MGPNKSAFSGMTPCSADGSQRIYAPVEQIELLLIKLEEMGLSSRAVLRECGCSFDLKDIRRRDISRIPLPAFVRLRDAAINGIRSRLDRTGETTMQRTDFELMMDCLIAGPTLQSLLERQSWFFDICGRKFGSSHIGISTLAVFDVELGPLEQEWAPFFSINALILFWKLMEWAAGEAFAVGFRIQCPEDTSSRAIADAFGVTVEYGAERNCLTFERGLLNRPLLRSPAELRTFLRHFPHDALILRANDIRLQTRVAGVYRLAITELKPVPTISDLADMFGQSSASLRRRLDQEGTSLREIKDTTRMNLAREYLCGTADDIESVTRRIGYSCQKTFTRAFKHSTGSTPAEFRYARLSDKGKDFGA